MKGKEFMWRPISIFFARSVAFVVDIMPLNNIFMQFLSWCTHHSTGRGRMQPSEFGSNYPKFISSATAASARTTTLRALANVSDRFDKGAKSGSPTLIQSQKMTSILV